jgi:hypothetical protein
MAHNSRRSRRPRRVRRASAARGRRAPGAAGATPARATTLGLGTAALLALAGAVSAGVATSYPAHAPAVARAAHVASVKDEGHLHKVGEPNGSNLVEEGPVTGTIPGRVRVSFNVGATVYATFTIYAAGGGTISGKGQGTLHSTSAYSTFGGSLTVTHGTGRYARAHGGGGLYGAINRKNSNYPMTVQAIGKLYY